jgi:hypothetical protein
VIPRPFRLPAPLALVLGLGLALQGPAPSSPAQELSAVAPQMTTHERLAGDGFWPRKSFESTAGHTGSAACGECHGAILQTQQATPMARTLAPAAPSHLAAVGGGGDIDMGRFRYRLESRPGGLGFTAGDGERSLAAPLDWVFGAGETGYTYVWRRDDGGFSESRFSYFPTLGRFAPTPGRLLGPPDSLEMALGHPLPAPEARGCFSCHATAMISGEAGDEAVDPRRLTPGITCEGCHGPGADHVALQKSGLDGAAAVFDPGRLGPHAVVDFCGACHHTYWDVALSATTGVATVRSPGYRLVKSRCWGDGDPRLTCLACHDPHRELERAPAAYDGACRACHGGAGPHDAPESEPTVAQTAEGAAGAGTGGVAGAAPRACPVGTARCVSCHMAKVELPGVHVESTDHWIRVVRPGEEFPE